MKINKYLGCFFKDLLTACGALMIIVSLFLMTHSTEIIKTSLLWQIILIASAYTFFKFAFVNKYELSKKAQLISFTICSTLADIMVVLWLCLFSPGKITDKNLIVIYIIVIFIVKGAVYTMMYLDGHKQAKQLNEKLGEYNNNSGEQI